MAGGDKTVSITGRVELEGNAAANELRSILAELKAFREAATEGAVALAEIETAGSGAAEGVADATKAVAEGAVAAAEGGEKAAVATKKVAEGAKEASLASRVLAGIWQGVGVGLGVGVVKLLWSGLSKLTAAVLESVDAAGEFDDIWTRAAVRGVTATDELRTSAVKLADALGVGLLEASNAVMAAFGATKTAEQAAKLAEVALLNLKESGASATESMDAARQVTWAFGLEADQTAGILARVAEVSRGVKVDQDELWTVLTKVAPQAKQVGIAFEDLLGVTEASLSKGLPMKQTLTSLQTVLEQIFVPTEEFTDALVNADVISAKSTQTWKQQRLELVRLQGELAELNAQEHVESDQLTLLNAQLAVATGRYEAVGNELAQVRSDLAAVNAELNTLQRLSSELNGLTSEAERRSNKYSELNKKKATGERLSRAERKELRELEKQLESYTEQLGSYERVQALSSDHNIRQLDLTDKLAARLKAAAEVQADISEETARAQLTASDLEATSSGLTETFDVLSSTMEQLRDSITGVEEAFKTAHEDAVKLLKTGIDGVEKSVESLGETLSTELTAAIRELVGESGLGGFLKLLQSSPRLVELFDAQTQTFIHSTETLRAGIATTGSALQWALETAAASGGKALSELNRTAEAGVGGFLSMMAQAPEIVSRFGGQAQILEMAAVAMAKALSDGTLAGEAAIERLRQRSTAETEANLGATDKLTNRVKIFFTELARVFAASKDALSAALLQLFTPDNMAALDGQMNRLQSWAGEKASAIGTRIVGDLRAVFQSDKTWGDVLGGWWTDGWGEISETVGPLVEKLAAEFEAHGPLIKAALVRVFEIAAEAAMQAAWNLITTKLQEWDTNLQKWLIEKVAATIPGGNLNLPWSTGSNYGSLLGFDAPAASGLKDLGAGISAAARPAGMAGYGGGVGSVSAATGGDRNNYFQIPNGINVYGSEPQSTAREVMRKISDLERLGVKGTRRGGLR